jgi:hypothetical protein
MTNQVPKYVTRGGAYLLLGIAPADLSRIANELGLGRSERAGDQEETYFTYDELQRIPHGRDKPRTCLRECDDDLSSSSVEGVHGTEQDRLISCASNQPVQGRPCPRS